MNLLEQKMARGDLLVKLVKAGSNGDLHLFRKIAESLIAEERANQHHILAEQLAENLNKNGNSSNNGPNKLDRKISNLFYEISPNRNLNDLILPNHVIDGINELIEEQNRKDLLRSYNLEPRNRVLLIGPPGNGKTSLAEAIANELMLPMHVVRYQGIIGSYLGETASRLSNLFDYIKTKQGVLFFDEFDVLGKERGDINETGEIKRVVSSLLLQIDDLPSHVVVIVASNHPELLDKAVWRRFQLRFQLPSPSKDQIIDWLKLFEDKIEIDFKHSYSKIAENLNGLNFSEIEEFGVDVYRKYILELPDSNVKKIINQKLEQWKLKYKN